METEQWVHIPYLDFDQVSPLSESDKDTTGYKNYTEQQLQNVQSEHNMNLREKYAQKAFEIVGYWLGGIGGITLLQGLSTSAFNLSDTIMVALISSATAGVLGLPIIVLHNLFPSKKSVNR